ncbi:hypothetical protein GCM10010495_54910 [Kitasatospora herbaricolor]|nr:hypothetical protein GCM10010495_54910 [Kitasatospora herbaricolor]
MLGGPSVAGAGAGADAGRQRAVGRVSDGLSGRVREANTRARFSPRGPAD